MDLTPHFNVVWKFDATRMRAAQARGRESHNLNLKFFLTQKSLSLFSLSNPVLSLWFIQTTSEADFLCVKRHVYLYEDGHLHTLPHSMFSYRRWASSYLTSYHVLL